MTTTQQPLALKLAEAVKTHEHHPQYKFYGMVSDELRRLHARVVELESRLEVDHQHGIDGIEARDCTIRLQDTLIDELKSQLEAIGAGGVEALRGAKPLTDEQILKLQESYVGGVSPQYPLDSSDWINFARAIEINHKIGA